MKRQTEPQSDRKIGRTTDRETEQQTDLWIDGSDRERITKGIMFEKN